MSRISFRFVAVMELLQRYGEATRRAWGNRRALESPPRLPYETQFLPAALALQEMPVSPLPRVTMWLLIVFSGIALTWAVIGQVEIVAVAKGKIVPDDRTKTIQPIETATIKSIHITDGQEVKKGQLLLELDGTMAEADLNRVADDLANTRLQVIRAKAMLAALVNGKAPVLDRSANIEERRWQEAQQLVQGYFDEFTAKIARIDAEIAKRMAEKRSAIEVVHRLEQTVPIAQKRATDYKFLVDRDTITKHDYLDREQARIEQEGELEVQRNRIREIEASLREALGQKNELITEVRRANLDSLNEGVQKATGLELELLKANKRDKLLKLTAPVDGTVQQLAVHTIGGVVTPAQPLMTIVPADYPMEIEAFIENKDIGFVKVGQDATVKIETFPYTKYGTIPATVTTVSHDAFNDEKRGLIYTARVNMHRTRINVDGTEISLSPGMAVTVEVKTGKRRVIEFFLSPLIQNVSSSLHER